MLSKLGTIGAGDGSQHALCAGGQERAGVRAYYGLADDDLPGPYRERRRERLEKNGVNWDRLSSHAHALLNGTAAILLLWGFFLLIPPASHDQHRKVHDCGLLRLLGVPGQFIWFYSLSGGPRDLQSSGRYCTVYLSILGTHTVLAGHCPRCFGHLTLEPRDSSRASSATLRHRQMDVALWMYVSVRAWVV